MTARDLIARSLKLIGVLAAGETPDADDQADALQTLNDMLDSWSNDSLLVYSKTRETFALVSGQAAYTMGTGGDFDTARPQLVENAGIEVPGTSPIVELPVEIITKDQFAEILVKSITSSIPRRLFPDYNNPLATITVWPVPTGAPNLILYCWKPITNLAIDDVLTLPPGFARAMRYNLACDLAPEYGKEPSMKVQQTAQDSLADIRRMNITAVLLKVDAGLLSQNKPFNIWTGE